VHGKDLEAMYEKVPKNLLPKEYGGDAGSILDLAGMNKKFFGNLHNILVIISEDFKKKLLDFNDFFLADEKNGVDEKKRIGRAKTQQELFGMEGSFRQLTVD